VCVCVYIYIYIIKLNYWKWLLLCQFQLKFIRPFANRFIFPQLEDGRCTKPLWVIFVVVYMNFMSWHPITNGLFNSLQKCITSTYNSTSLVTITVLSDWNAFKLFKGSMYYVFDYILHFLKVAVSCFLIE